MNAPPEALTSSFAVSHSMLLNVLDRPGDGRADLHRLIAESYEPDTRKAEHEARAAALYDALLDAEVIEELDAPDDFGRTVRVTIDLQETFALNQPLAPFALAALDLLDPEDPAAHALDVVSLVEAILDDPRPVIAAQINKAKGEAVAAMKAAGMEYEERMAELEQVTHPRPLADLLDPMFEVYRGRHPWVSEHPLRPKSVVRDLWERAMGFGDYVRVYQLARSEGLVLRYLSDAYKTLDRTIPDDRKTHELVDLIEWLGELVRQVDSSLLDEWEALRSPDAEAATDHGLPATRPGDDGPPPVTANRRAFSILVRNALFQRVELLARRAWGELEDLDGEDGWTKERWFEALGPYFDRHGTVLIDGDARSAALLQVTEGADRWDVRQVLHDPATDHDWGIEATVDLRASDAEGAPVVHVAAVRPLE